MTISNCIDCGCVILGERIRCPRHHEVWARSVLAPVAPPDPDAITIPRPRVVVETPAYRVLAIGLTLLLGGIVIAIVKACQ